MSHHPRRFSQRIRTILTASAATAVAVVGLAVPVHAATGSQTTVPLTTGKGQGSGQWGFVGDIETLGAATGTTFSYGLAFSPVDDSLWVTDSGKVSSGFACTLAGLASPCQFGTPRIFKYDNTVGPAGTGEATLGEYTVDGAYASGTAVSQSPNRNSGIGAKYDTLAARDTVTFPAAEKTQHGPRGVTFTADGTAWIVDSEAVAPLTGAAGAIKRYAPDLTPLAGAGWTGAWADKDKPGVHFYRVGAATTPKNTVLVNSEVSDRLQEYAADGTWIRSLKLDVPASPGAPNLGDPGYRNPYGVTVDPVDGSMYIPLVNFRDDTYWKTQDAFLEKRDANGAVIGTIGKGYLPKGQVVFASAVEPKTQHVFVWSQTSAVFEFTKDGTFVRQYNSTQFPGLSNVRGLAFDTNGRMYFTVAEGTGNTRVMILGKTPEPVRDVCGTYNPTRTEATLHFACDSVGTAKTAYQQTPVRDFVVEASTDGGTTWSLMPKGAASTATTRTVTGLDPAASYQFRVSAWNEAGNSDWTTISMVDYAAQPDTATTQAPTAVTVDVAANDSGTSTPTSTFLVDAAGASTHEVSIAGQGTFSMVAGKVVFTPGPNFVGTTDAVTYRVQFGDCVVESTVRVTVTPAPVVEPSTPTNPTTAPTTGPTTAPTTSPTLPPVVAGERPAGIKLIVKGANPSAWTLTAAGPTKVTGGNGVSDEVEPGTYALTKSGPPGYDRGEWTCRTRAGKNVQVRDGKVKIRAGQFVVCTIVNTQSLQTISFQVDRYLISNAATGRRVVGLARDGVLRYREDRFMWGRSRWQFVTVTVPANASQARLRKAINARTSNRVGNVTVSTRPKGSPASGAVVMAWRLGVGAAPVPGRAWGADNRVNQHFVAWGR